MLCGCSGTASAGGAVHRAASHRPCKNQTAAKLREPAAARAEVVRDWRPMSHPLLVSWHIFAPGGEFTFRCCAQRYTLSVSDRVPAFSTVERKWLISQLCWVPTTSGRAQLFPAAQNTSIGVGGGDGAFGLWRWKLFICRGNYLPSQFRPTPALAQRMAMISEDRHMQAALQRNTCQTIWSAVQPAIATYWRWWWWQQQWEGTEAAAVLGDPRPAPG